MGRTAQCPDEPRLLHRRLGRLEIDPEFRERSEPLNALDRAHRLDRDREHPLSYLRDHLGPAARRDPDSSLSGLFCVALLKKDYSPEQASISSNSEWISHRSVFRQTVP